MIVSAPAWKPDGNLLPDMNRIPVDFQSRPPSNHHINRAQELFALGQHISGILDIHSARGNMVCITDHKRDADLKDSPIRAVLIGLADAISANASAKVTVKTLKTILMPLPNIESQTGIEAGRHESPDAPRNAAVSFTLSLLQATLGLTPVKPLYKNETGSFERYTVQPRLTYADLAHDKPRTDDRVFMAKACTTIEDIPRNSSRVILRKKDSSYGLQTALEFLVNPAGELQFAVYQYDEMEAIKKNQVVAVAVPSGAAFRVRRRRFPASSSTNRARSTTKRSHRRPVAGFRRQHRKHQILLPL